MDNSADATFGSVVKLDYSKLKIGAAADSIMFIKLRANEKNEVGAMTFTMKNPADLPTTASRAGWVPIWWLPWQSKHIVKIKIRSVQDHPTIDFGNGIDPVDNPSLFFTAAINGCSVFAVGDSRFPSVYHGGVDGSMDQKQGNETTEQAWRRLLGRVNSTKNIKGIGKTDYITELNANYNNDDDRVRYNGFKTTSAARDFEQELSTRGQLTNTMVSPWGMVFGIRDSNENWTMSLVKNALLQYHRVIVNRQKRLFRKDKVTQANQGEKLKPRTYDADGNFTEGMGSVAEHLIRNCVSLGYQEFFPGLGQVQLYDQAQIQVY